MHSTCGYAGVHALAHRSDISIDGCVHQPPIDVILRLLVTATTLMQRFCRDCAIRTATSWRAFFCPKVSTTALTSTWLTSPLHRFVGGLRSKHGRERPPPTALVVTHPQYCSDSGGYSCSSSLEVSLVELAAVGLPNPLAPCAPRPAPVTNS